MSTPGPPGLQYPALPGNIDPKLEAAVRNVFDNLFYIRRMLDRPSIINTPAARAEIQRLISSQITTITQNITLGSCIVGSHNVRLTVYGSASSPTGTLFYEIDRHVLYVINDIPNKHWEFVAGCMVDVLANIPTDLGSTDVGFLFFATDTTTLYIWDGTAFVAAGGTTVVSSRQFWKYRAKTSATSGYPGDGYMLWNNATQTSATALLFSHLTQDDLDIDIFLSFLATGDTIIIQDADDSGNFQEWEITGTPTNTNPGTATSYWTAPVVLQSSGGTGTTGFPNNHSLIAVIFTAVTATVSVDPYGALDGDGSPGSPLAVRVDGVTVQINASNQLEAVFGSGGNVTYSTAFGSEPGSPNAGDLDLYTGTSGAINSPQIARSTGSVWEVWGPAWKFNPPVNGDYAWINQGSAAVDTTYGGVLLTSPAGAGDSWHIRKKSRPSDPTTTPYYIVAAWSPHLTENNHNRIGVGWRASGAGTLVGITMKNANWEVTKMNSATSFNTASTFTGVGSFYYGNLVWVQLVENGTNREAWLSRNGITWVRAYQEGRTVFLTADEVLFYVDPNNGNYGVGMLLLHWAQFTSFQGYALYT